MWRLRQEAVKAFQGLGLRLGQVAVLGFLDAGVTHPGEIAENLDYTPPLVSSLIASLEERGSSSPARAAKFWPTSNKCGMTS